MLKELAQRSTVYLVTGYSDLRKGIDGLCAVVQGVLSQDPFSQSLFLFCGKRRDRIKGLLWEEDGFLLLYKRLDNGSFRWPRTETEARQLYLSNNLGSTSMRRLIHFDTLSDGRLRTN